MSVEENQLIYGAAAGYEFRDTISLIRFRIGTLINETGLSVTAAGGFAERIADNVTYEMGLMVGYGQTMKHQGPQLGMEMGFGYVTQKKIYRLLVGGGIVAGSAFQPGYLSGSFSILFKL
jgi:hypothetical protein